MHESVPVVNASSSSPFSFPPLLLHDPKVHPEDLRVRQEDLQAHKNTGRGRLTVTHTRTLECLTCHHTFQPARTTVFGIFSHPKGHNKHGNKGQTRCKGGRRRSCNKWGYREVSAGLQNHLAFFKATPNTLSPALPTLLCARPRGAKLGVLSFLVHNTLAHTVASVHSSAADLGGERSDGGRVLCMHFVHPSLHRH